MRHRDGQMPQLARELRRWSCLGLLDSQFRNYADPCDPGTDVAEHRLFYKEMNRNSEHERCNDIDEHHADALFRIRECDIALFKAKHLEENGVCEIDRVRCIAH